MLMVEMGDVAMLVELIIVVIWMEDRDSRECWLWNKSSRRVDWGEQWGDSGRENTASVEWVAVEAEVAEW